MIHSKNLTIAVILCTALSFVLGKEIPEIKARRLEVLMLGHSSKHHDSEQLADILSKEYFKDGINITYSVNPDDLNDSTLAPYDALLLYANYDTISRSQEKALLQFVKNGKGFVPLHCASWCFRNSPEVVEMIGGQFATHKWDSFPAVIVKPGHTVMRGVEAFGTTDETYVHSKLSKEIEVLTERVEGSHREPYTWVRNFGKGRVFYTAYGHDYHTFYKKDFLQLVKNGILWAAGEQAQAELAALTLPQPKYTDAKLPNYEKRNPPPRLQEPLTPKASMDLTQVPVGFELELFASEPDIINPIYMNWDERGRLWVIETVDYPNTVREDKESGDDRIKILEDTDKDGKADKITVFADRLNIPTSFVFANDGIIVSQAPYFLFLKDTNADDKADTRDTLISGWGTYDTHAGPSNLRYGLDNKIWGTVGYSGFAGKQGADSLKFSQGLYRFESNGKHLEFLSGTSNNTWGLGFSEEFDVFVSTANNTHSGFFGIPYRYLNMAGIAEAGVEKIDAHYGMHVVTKNLRQVDVFGGFTAAAGHSLYTAREFPKEYWNRIAFVTEPTGRLIHRQILERHGAGFREKGDGWNMLASADEWAGPVQAEVGPDGALWILDWYDFIIQHNPTPEGFENGKGNAYIIPLRDHDRGRIYRIRYKNAAHPVTPSLEKNNAGSLVKALSSSNMFWRTTAQRLLVESGNISVFPELFKLVRAETVDEAGINAPALHALWTLDGLHAFDSANQEALDVAIGALRHPSAGVRRAAVQVLPRNTATLQALVKAKIFDDPDLRVRLAGLLACADMKPSTEIGTMVLNMALLDENANDPWIRNALFVGAKVHRQGFLTAFRKKGIPENPGLDEATVVQRIAMASRMTSLPVRWGLNLPPAEAPDVSGKEISISGSLEKPRDHAYYGVIVVHGDQKNGYGLYMKESKLYFRVNQDGMAYTINTPNALPAKFDFRAYLQQDGRARLLLNDKEVAVTRTKGLFKEPLKTGIRAYFDDRKGEERIGDYPESFRLRGNLSHGLVEMLEPGKSKKTEKVDQVIVIKVVKNVMKFDKELISVKAGSTVQLVVQNPDFMQHNLVIIKPKTTEKVGAAADKLAQDPNGAKLNYVPRMPEVLYATPLINPEGRFTLKFKVPDAEGNYPYVCTFPGHWRIMKGVMKVTK